MTESHFTHSSGPLGLRSLLVHVPYDLLIQSLLLTLLQSLIGGYGQLIRLPFTFINLFFFF